MVLNSLMLAGGGFIESFVVVLSSVIVLRRTFPVLDSLSPVERINEPVPEKLTGNLADVVSGFRVPLPFGVTIFRDSAANPQHLPHRPNCNLGKILLGSPGLSL